MHDLLFATSLVTYKIWHNDIDAYFLQQSWKNIVRYVKTNL